MAVTRRNFISVGTGAPAIATLLRWLGWVEAEIRDGKVNDGWNSGDASGHKMIDLNLPAERRRLMILNDLSILDPETYPPRDYAPVKRTIPLYV